MYEFDTHKRSEVSKVRYRPDEMCQLRREAALAGMQLATYIRKLSMLGRELGAADVIRQMNGLDDLSQEQEQHKTA
ncbi:plasmid mobilization protein [Pseudomonas sp. NPDC087358]|uniref:plasmid mobilization protein n=1 Tax=Pseudomonas sp. NPDC087358 TaxID=3364439 RepID=UPI00384A86EE